MSKFKLTQTAAEVQNILNNSLQKPTGLAKTKLVGVGVNGQENIEIGDNLTLANGKLAVTGVSLPSTITFDEEGNRTVQKNLTVSGDIKKPEFASTFTGGKIPIASANNYNLGDIVSTSLGHHSSGGGFNYDCTPLFFKKRDPSFANSNPTLYYAYATEDSNNFTVDGLMLQGNIGVSVITIHADGIVMRVVYLSSTPKYSNYLFPQVAKITDYSSFVRNVINNPRRFISITGITTKGIPLALRASGGKLYVNCVNTTSLAEEEVEIPQSATLEIKNQSVSSNT